MYRRSRLSGVTVARTCHPTLSIRTAALLLLAVVAASCRGSSGTPTAPSTDAPAPPAAASPVPTPPPAPVVRDDLWDLETRGTPRFVTRQYLDLRAIARISRFRSGAGHSYADAFESCRSMKHYFEPYHGTDWGAIPIVSPVDGTVVRKFDEWAGVQLHIEAQNYRAVRIILFHVRPTMDLSEGTRLQAGQHIGTHVSSQTSSDVAVSVNTPQGFRLVSWFDVLDDAAFGEYAARGVSTRSAAIISQAERDAHPLSCAGEAFAGPGDLDNWITLR